MAEKCVQMGEGGLVNCRAQWRQEWRYKRIWNRRKRAAEIEKTEVVKGNSIAFLEHVNVSGQKAKKKL